MTDLRCHFKHYMDRVDAGESFVLTRYGKPVAVILPVPEYMKLGGQL